MNYGLIGLGAFVVALLAGRYINERGLRKLSEKDQATLISGLSRFRMISLAGVVLIVAVYFIFFGYAKSEETGSLFVFMFVLLAYMLIGTAFVFIKMKKLQIQEDYISTYLLSSTVQYLGLIVYFAISSW